MKIETGVIVKERPILFSAPMVRAILDGRKTQTRRVIKPAPKVGWHFNEYDDQIDRYAFTKNTPHEVNELRWCTEWFWARCPFGKVGDLLWVRECFSPYLYREGCWYWADGNMAAFDAEKPRPSIHMHRHESRLTLEIMGVRVQRLQEMTHMNWRRDFCPSPRELEMALITHYGDENRYTLSRKFWDSLNAARGFGWDTNPWVWVIEFKRV